MLYTQKLIRINKDIFSLLFCLLFNNKQKIDYTFFNEKD